MFDYKDIARADYYFVVSADGVVFTDTANLSRAEYVACTLAEISGKEFLVYDKNGVVFNSED